MTSDGQSHRTRRTAQHLETLQRFERSGFKGADLEAHGVKPWHTASLRHGKALRPSTLRLINDALDRLQTQNPMESASPMPEARAIDLSLAYFDAVRGIVETIERQPVQVRAKMIELISKLTAQK